MLDRLPRFAERILASGLGSTSPTADLPEDHFVEVLGTIYGCAHAFLHATDQGREFTYEEVAGFVGPVVEHHAEDRLPLRLLVEAVHGSARQVLREAVELSGPDELDELVDFGDRLLQLLMHITTVTVESYGTVEQSIHHAEREARRALCAALLRGQPAEELAARADLALSERYTVLAIGPRIEEQPAAVANLLTRRRIRLLQHTLDRLAGAPTLHTFDGSHAIALLPNGSESDITETSGLASELAEQFGVDVFLAEIPAVPRDSIPDAAQQATELTELARLLGRPSGAYRLDDLLLEYQLTRPGSARDRLAERIAPLLRSPHLLETLDAHLRHGSDRKAAAAEIHVHPNTFSYRLRRIAELTGTDPGDPNGSRLLAAALTVHRLHPVPETIGG
ncbi:DNA-binding PucR family transcriptional regulator [Nocardia mexicana]|uniref:DNA-binding PucR family transcriptional regulator n=2 Tax=Nocardia mexicana TaxID=279262 RepID=A0A370H899_9NOCA|nr:DNA-binding PucR family transcriptional regulator [Nocardia mexicana]